MGRRRAVHGPQHEVPGRLAATHGGQRLVAQGRHAVGVVEQHLAGRRQLQALAFAQEQLDAQLLLKLAQARRQVRRHPMQALCSTGDRAFLGHGLEDTQLTELHDILQNRTT
ncbi:hypothetical protein D3C85_1379610 [compost metagenome]